VLAQGHEVVVESPRLLEDGPEDGSGVALGQDEQVGAASARIAGIPSHLVEEEDGDDLGATTCTMWVARSRFRVDSRDNRRSFCAIKP